MVSENDRRQVLMLREVGPNTYHGGRGTIGVRLLEFEVGSPAELDAIEQRLTMRQAFVGRVQTETYTGILGLDPDRIELSVASGLTGVPIQTEDWNEIDNLIYAIE
jgi:hypothetical protein